MHVLRVEAWDALHFLPIYNFHRSHNSINITWQILYLFQYIVFMSASKEGRTSYFYLFWMWRGMKYWHLYARFPSQLLNQSPDNNIPWGMGKTKQSNIAISIGKTVNQCGVHFMYCWTGQSGNQTICLDSYFATIVPSQHYPRCSI